MKVIYIKQTVGREIGDIIEIDGFFAKSLINDGIAEAYHEKKQEATETPEPIIHKDVLDAPEVIVPKKKGNPNFGKKK